MFALLPKLHLIIRGPLSDMMSEQHRRASVMIRNTLLRLHRWTTLVFALPLIILFITGLILSFEPMVATPSLAARTVTAQTLDGLLARHDPAGKARGLALRSYDGSLSLTGLRGQPVVIDLATGAERSGLGPVAQMFLTARRLHEHLIFDLDWLVTASTIALLVVVGLGVTMGWPRLHRSLSGWHKGIAWFSLPLVIASPLTGLCLAFGITFASGPGASAGSPLPLRDALAMVAAAHDPAHLIWLRSRGRNQLARIEVGGEYRIFAVGRDGLKPSARNWPRLIHEGNWAGAGSAFINIVTSLALLGLFGTGLLLWGRRRLRRRAVRAPA
jgi:uncharacterized iron-regulated membrane protein